MCLSLSCFWRTLERSFRGPSPPPPPLPGTGPGTRPPGSRGCHPHLPEKIPAPAPRNGSLRSSTAPCAPYSRLGDCQDKSKHQTRAAAIGPLAKVGPLLLALRSKASVCYEQPAFSGTRRRTKLRRPGMAPCPSYARAGSSNLVLVAKESPPSGPYSWVTPLLPQSAETRHTPFLCLGASFREGVRRNQPLGGLDGS